MTPPHVERARDSVLGTLLHYYVPESVVVVQAQGVQPADFGPPECRAHVMYRAILALHRNRSSVDPVTLEGFLSRHGMLERAGGVAYMEVLAVSAVPSALREHAFLVAESSAWWSYQLACEAAVRFGYERDVDHAREALRCAGVALARVRGEQPAPLRIVKGAA